MSLQLSYYRPEWPIEFKNLSEVMARQLIGLPFDIQHVGSTAVPGLVAKPVIDIDIIIEDRSLLSEIIKRLEMLGYEYRGDQGIPDRFVFRQSSEHTPEVKPRQKWLTHHLYGCLANSLALRNHLRFRDALRSNHELLKKYSNLKLSLIQHVISREEYGKRKTAFIIAVLAELGFSPTELDDIRKANE